MRHDTPRTRRAPHATCRAAHAPKHETKQTRPTRPPLRQFFALLLAAALLLAGCNSQRGGEVSRSADGGTQNQSGPANPTPQAPQAMPAAGQYAAASVDTLAESQMSAKISPKGAGAGEDEDAERRFNTEGYSRIDENPFLTTARAPLSTFSIDVDTASYSNTRRFLNTGQLPPKDAVRVEELVNYFTYDYPQPAGPEPFSVTAETAACPWNDAHRLVLVGLQGRQLAREQLPPANLVFLVDVSGSMEDEAKLPLVQSSLRLLAGQLTGRDRVAVVVYAGASGLVLPSTPGDRRNEIIAAVENLRAGGSTNGGDGIRLAYKVARENFIQNGVNRVVLATDGDFNVGTTSEGELVRLVEEERKSGVFLSVLGFGTGNLKDSTMEKLADHGNGNYAYIDTPAEARKVLGQQLGGTLATIAKDVKIQVEFNPRAAAGYRLIGYENRLLRDEDFNDDQKDAGEIGAGHTVTALYEVVPAGREVPAGGVDELKYQRPATPSEAATGGELMTIKLRYKQPDGAESRLVSLPVADAARAWQGASDNFRFASAVAAFGLLLRDSRHKGSSNYAGVAHLARSSAGRDPHGHRAEFVRLVEAARTLSSQQARN